MVVGNILPSGSCQGRLRSWLSPDQQRLVSTARFRRRPVAVRWHKHLRCAADGTSSIPADPHKAAVTYVIGKYVKDGATVGFGTGPLVSLAIEYLGQCLEIKRFQGVRAVAASDVSASEAAFHGVPLTSLQQAGQVDVVIEEADELDVRDGRLPFVLGRASEPHQPQLLRARALAAATRLYIALVSDQSQVVKRLSGALPVLVEAATWEVAGEELDDLFLPDAEVWRRPTSGRCANPRGGDNPYVSPDGHNLMDVRFYGKMKLMGEDALYEDIAMEVEGVPGVVTHGLMVGTAHVAVVAHPDGPREYHVSAKQAPLAQILHSTEEQ